MVEKHEGEVKGEGEVRRRREEGGTGEMGGGVEEGNKREIRIRACTFQNVTFAVFSASSSPSALPSPVSPFTKQSLLLFLGHAHTAAEAGFQHATCPFECATVSALPFSRGW